MLNALQGKIAVISDIHANAVALRCAIEQIDRTGADAIICLGDLLTYGGQPLEVIDDLLTLQQRYPMVFISGNHDHYYFDLASDSPPKLDSLPSFIRESMLWTFASLKQPLAEQFNWQNELQIQHCYFSHANPFGYKNWRYLNTTQSLLDAASALLQRDACLGCFGHTHRQQLVELDCLNSMPSNHQQLKIKLAPPSVERSIILNTGSIGQPRGFGYGFLSLEFNGASVTAKHQAISPDKSAIIHAIKQAKLTADSEHALIRYHVNGKS